MRQLHDPALDPVMYKECWENICPDPMADPAKPIWPWSITKCEGTAFLQSLFCCAHRSEIFSRSRSRMLWLFSRKSDTIVLEKEKRMEKKENWAYLVRCADGTLYAGWTNDLERRLETHNAGKGAKYTRSRRPVTLVWCWKPQEAAEQSLPARTDPDPTI